MREQNRDGLHGILAMYVYGSFTLILPLLKVFGGFIIIEENVDYLGSTIETSIEFYWDSIVYNLSGLVFKFNYVDFVNVSEEIDVTILFLIQLIGVFWIILTILAIILITIPSMQLLCNEEPINTAKYGMIIGSIATIAEIGIFLLIYVLYTELAMRVNLVLLSLFLIGIIALFYGYTTINQYVPRTQEE